MNERSLKQPPKLSSRVGRHHSFPGRLSRLVILLSLAWFGFTASGAEPQNDSPEPADPAQTQAAGPDTVDARPSSVGVRLGGGGVSPSPGSVGIDIGGAHGKPSGHPSLQGKPFKRVEIVGAPIPVINPTVGNGLAGLGAIAIHLDPNDKKSPPSIFGGGVGFTSNGTHAFGVGAALFLKEDRFRILGVFAGGKVNYDYYGIGHGGGETGLFIPITLDASGFLIEPKVRVVGHWYVGPRYLLMKSDVALDRERLQEEFPNLPLHPDRPIIPERDVKVQAGALGFRVLRDTRDSQFYPLKGSVFDTKIDFAEPAFASQRSYQNVNVSFQAYQAFRQKNVIAYRGSLCSASGDVPFYGLCMFGQSQDVRGYAVGRYQDRRMLVGQVEFRRELFWRIGAVAYFGAGEVAPEFSKLNTKDILPGGGVGVRFTLAEQSKINLRVDYAWGIDSKAFYVSLGESF